jgi:hypothetical protein
MTTRKNLHLNRNIEIAVAVIVIMLIALVAGFYSGLFDRVSTPTPTSLSGAPLQTLTPTPTNGTVLQGDKLNVGDIFTYKLTGVSVLGSADAVTPDELLQYNNTDYYQVTITGINGSTVSLDTLWRFNNGTEVTSPQIIDISNGAKADPNGFWAIYASNLNVNDLLHPKGTDGFIVNSTGTQTFATSRRVRNYWSIESQFVDTNDPTGNTMRDDFMGVYFDKQTGMLDSLTHIEFYTNPEIELIITWQLTSSNVWAV